MARLPLIEPADAPTEVQTVYKRFETLGFPIFNVMKMFANNPKALEGFAMIVEALYGPTCALSPRYRELAYLRASQVNSCHY
jgi:alkylhydroperoxidase family enzyme